ncbi:hypothetical protein ETI08_03560 [Macrococcoides goetzii]|nr:hypothetical protein [Macrococcus goetzii]TDM48228.1 hypothetical protein ETI08_03560 [Macrococcus goetzii]
MNTINIEGQIYDLVPRQTIIAEEQQQTFTPPHDIHSEVKGNINVITPDGQSEPLFVDDYSDINNILEDVKACLHAQNEKGINEYGVPLSDSTLSIVEISNYELEESVDVMQYNRVKHNRLLEVIELLEQEPPQVQQALILLRGDADETTV